MIVLALDTALGACSAAVVCDDVLSDARSGLDGVLRCRTRTFGGELLGALGGAAL